jgi:hypothetical protein
MTRKSQLTFACTHIHFFFNDNSIQINPAGPCSTHTDVVMSAAETEVVRFAHLPPKMQPGTMLLLPKIHIHTHLTCRHDDLVIQRTSTICRYKPQRLLLHGHQPPVVLACCVQANCLGRHHQSTYSSILLHTFGGLICVLSAETYLDTSLSLLLSTRYFCAGSLWHIKQLSASKMVPNG